MWNHRGIRHILQWFIMWVRDSTKSHRQPNTNTDVSICALVYLHRCIMWVCVVVVLKGWSLRLRDSGRLNEWNDGGIESGEEKWDRTERTGHCNPPHNSSSWTSVSANRLYYCQSALPRIKQQGEEMDGWMDGEVDGEMWLRGVISKMEGRESEQILWNCQYCQ